MTINKAIEKLYLAKELLYKEKPDYAANKVKEAITILKSIEKVTGEEIAEAIFPGYIASPEIAAKIISKRIWGE